ncbi:MAG: helix-turn-helix transcriptional regulator [Roseibium sp.]
MREIEINVTAWADTAIAASGRKNKEIAEILDLSPASISRIRKGEQALSAEHMLVLSRELKTPLPGETDREESRDRRDLDRGLYLKALDHVVKDNSRRPPEDRMNQFEILDSVFFVYEALIKINSTEQNGSA